MKQEDKVFENLMIFEQDIQVNPLSKNFRPSSYKSKKNDSQK